MEIVAKSIKNLLSKIEYLDNESTIMLDINKDKMKYTIIVRNAQCRFIGNIPMFVDGAIEITINGLNFLHNRTIVPVGMAEYYLGLLDNITDKNIIHSIKLLMKEQLKIGDTVKWENGRVGIIVEPNATHNGQIYYRLLKKNGEVGAREFILYGKTKEYNYKCMNREFKDYSVLLK